MISDQEETTLTSTKRHKPIRNTKKVNNTQRLIDNIMNASGKKVKRHRELSQKRMQRMKKEAQELKKISNRLK